MVEIMKNYLIKLYVFMFLFFKKTHYSDVLNDEDLKECYWQTNIIFSTILLMPILGVIYSFINFKEISYFFEFSGIFQRVLIAPFVLIYLVILFYFLNKIKKIVSFDDKYFSDFTLKEKIVKYVQVFFIFLSVVGVPMFFILLKKIV